MVVVEILRVFFFFFWGGGGGKLFSFFRMSILSRDPSHKPRKHYVISKGLVLRPVTDGEENMERGGGRGKKEGERETTFPQCYLENRSLTPWHGPVSTGPFAVAILVDDPYPERDRTYFSFSSSFFFFFSRDTDYPGR